MSATPPHSVSVAGVTIDDAGRVLVIKRHDNGEWQAPGGVLESAETFEQGVAREVFEETGVEVEVEHLTGVYKNLHEGVVALVYRCRPTGGTAAPTAEAADVSWLNVDDATERMSPAFAVRVRDAVTPGGLPASRVHNGTEVL